VNKGPTGTASTCFSHDDYTVGWICTLPFEMAAAKAILNEIHPSLPNSLDDYNTYTLGQIGAHNIVIACMPSGVYGMTSAVVVATSMRSSFTSIRVGLMVGIGGGVPSRHADI
jgi:nucleoside phosphorylase